MRVALVVLGLTAAVLREAPAQEWNNPESLALVRQAVARRAADSDGLGFVDFTAHAQGFVLFLAQLGGALTDPPRLVQADQLALEVYWKAPGQSKQRIVGRRDRIDFPTGISYHRDHLGIVPGNYADRIRIGNCDEICNVLHPLAASGLAMYDYAIVDSLRMEFIGRTIQVYEVMVRPKDVASPAVVGSLYLEIGTGQVVRMRISFTRSAYSDDALEDITILLDNALWEGRHWLPRLQEIEVRRRTSWLDFPARGIIRTTLRIDGYEFDTGLEDAVFRGLPIVQAPESLLAGYDWDESLDDALRGLASVREGVDLDEVRGELSRVVSQRMLSGLAPTRLGADSLSGIARFNRVEGLALGAGIDVSPLSGRLELRTWLGFGFSDERFKARVRLRHRFARGTVGVAVTREIRDVMDEPVVSGVLNSVLAQELGNDFGDYYLLDRAALQGQIALGHARVWGSGGYEYISSVETAATPAAGSFDANPALGDGAFWFGRMRAELGTAAIPGTVRWQGSAMLEYGSGASGSYGRASGSVGVGVPVGPTRLETALWGGWGTDGLPTHRSFAVGGRGTLVGEGFRAWGGNSAAVATVEWRLPVPVPAIPIGSLGSTGHSVTVAPFLGALWTGRQGPGSPWQSSDGTRAVVGLAGELLNRLIRIDVGYSIRDGRIRAVFDVNRAFWPIL